MVLLCCVDDCLMISTSKDKNDEVYASLQEDLKIEDDGDLNNYLGIELDHFPDVSIHLSQLYLIQRIHNTITCTDKSISKLTPEVKPPQVKIEGFQEIKNDFNYRSKIGFLTSKKFNAPQGAIRGSSMRAIH